MKLRHWRSALAWALIAVIAIPPRLLDAHAHLKRSAPAASEHLAQAPAQVRLWFSEKPVLGLTRVQLLAPDSSGVPLGAIQAGDEMSVSVAIVGSLAAGTYTVVWRTAAADGHPSSGRLRFTVDAAGATPASGATAAADAPSVEMAAASGDSQPRGRSGDRGHVFITTARDSTAMPSGRGYVAARWVELVALLVAIGAMTLRFALPRAIYAAGANAGPGDAIVARGVTDSVLRLLRPTLVLLFVAQLVRLGGEWELVRQAGAGDVTLRTLLSTGWGYGWLMGVAGVVVAAAGAATARRFEPGWWIAAAGTLVAALSPAVTGHAIASADHATLAVTADFLHVLGGGAWLGALAVIVLAAIPAIRDADRDAWGSRTAQLLTGFTPIALTGASVILVSGLVSAWLRLGSVRALWETPYGVVLLIKVALAGIVVLLGAWNWRRVQPSIAAGASPTRVRRSASIELVTSALLLVATAILIALPTPV